jgi:ATP/maltotriose-dependent transcriptional regulator MalT
MNEQFEGVDCVFCDFKDDDPPPDLTVRPAPAAFIRRLFPQQVLADEAFSLRNDLDELLSLARDEQQAHLISNDRRGACFCLGNQAVIAKVKGDAKKASELATEAENLAAQFGIPELAARMQAIRQMTNGG